MASVSSSSHRSASYQPPAPASSAPQGTFLPGTKVQVGSHRVVIEKYLSEGGFAHVYVVRLPREDNKHELAVLKRVAVPDKEHLTSMRTEVETMKKLKGHKHVVTYMDSHASQLKGGGYEVFLLMEYCSGGGLIDFMNTRLQHRLTEPEILKIFGDIAEGVACMHYLKPPLLHRDLKVENVLISKTATGATPMYKLCDFGSAAPPRPAAKTADEGRLIEEDVQKHTTMQYRSPEMIDVWRKQPIDEKADIWALGVFLYKLCYYTTPFEDVGQMAILNATFKYPSQPRFSERIKKLIGWMLKEDPKQRPNIYQVIKEVCSMRDMTVPIKDIYANRTHSEARRNESLPDPEPAVGLQKQTPQVQVESIPDITPMRRGRPTAPAQQAPVAAKPSPSPAAGDPFAALDSKDYDVRSGAVDELSKKFPSLDEFSIVHDKGKAFPFASPSPSQAAGSTSKNDLNGRVANALADEVFNSNKSKAESAKPQRPLQIPQQSKASPALPSSVQSKPREMPKQAPLTYQPTPVRPEITYTDTGVGTSPPQSATKKKFPEISSRPIWRVPDHSRSQSQSRALDGAQGAALSPRLGLAPSNKAAVSDLHRSKSQTSQVMAKSTISSRPSLEGHRPSQLEVNDESLTRTRSVQSRQRPSSVYLSSNMDYLRDQEAARKRPSMEERRHSGQPVYDTRRSGEEIRIDDDMDFLRRTESNEIQLQPNSSNKALGHKTRGSFVNAKNMVTGRFGDALKLFEGRSSQDTKPDPVLITPEPRDDESEPPILSPILGSEPTAASKQSDSGSAIDETEDLPPDVRRELERRKLSIEEKRVAEAAAEYRARVSGNDTGSASIPTRASTIQKRVQSLLDEGRQSPAPQKRTAEGYGRYTDSQDVQPRPSNVPSQPAKMAPPPIAKKPVTTPDFANEQLTKVRTEPVPPSTFNTASIVQQSTQPQPRVVPRPSVPPKSQALRTGGNSRSQWPPNPQVLTPNTDKALPPKPPGGLAALLAKDLEGVPDYPPRGSSMTEPVKVHSTTPAGIERRSVPEDHMQAQPTTAASLSTAVFPDSDMETDFSKRYPSLSGIEMVETEIGQEGRQLTMKEV